ncbi:lytic transglycosylase [Mucilaginibacter sp. PPCGB 2223]|uniref:lytic transglycosylase domain-containing protein n=1 Tax=Mucilaginibacter sp. PPCGB 2223 TaxID=1886027 RepID=UPI0008248AD5|nr:lytic transglycosylase domain-containing protein [Mucilaginibacter sp. PPCGB 2223]OCX50731.1 lytic transglycosylase [Mucilaginibacter sp. PPCGB 2223]
MRKLSTFIACLFIIQVAKADLSKTFTPVFRADSSALNSNHRDTTILPVVTVGTMSYQGAAFKHRLDSIQKEIPLDYNEYVQSYIDIYTSRKEEMARVLGLTKYYFPIYEKAFHDAGVPEEIKYLSIVESALDPYAVSRVGATGPWQFMFATAKLYGLNIDNYVDERRDPIQASYAAAAYIKDAYLDFGDWLVAIASYNCGKGAITRAIEKAGASDFWSIRPYLPAETRNYVPAFIAIAYVMNNYSKHGIAPRVCEMPVKTDTILVNKYVSLANISKVLNVDTRQISMLNPQYKMQVVNGSDAAPKRLVIPQIDKASFTQLYDALNDPNITSEQFEPVRTSVNETPAKKKLKESTPEIPASHRVKKGETLASIADKYGMEVSELKAWNHLSKSKVATGTELRLTAPPASESASAKKTGRNFITYKVRQGDTLSAIAEKFDGLTVEKIKSANNLKGERLQPGMTLKITKG